MSKYTTEVRFICESAIPLEEQGSFYTIEKSIQSGRNKIFNFHYDIFDDNYKPVIETKFLRHYYTREIGQETFALWKLKLEDLWNLKLPYYNQMWKSLLYEIDPFKDVDYFIKDDGKNIIDSTQTQSGNVDKYDTIRQTDKVLNMETKHTGTETIKTDNTRTEDLLDKYSDTPQGALDGVIDTDWLTNARQNDNTMVDDNTTIRTPNLTDTSNGTSTRDGDNVYKTVYDDVKTKIGGTDTRDYLKHIFGKMNTKSYPKLLMEYRESFINVDEMFINEFKDLFMLIY